MANATAYALSPTGLDLRLRRVANGVTQTELARRMGVPRQRVTGLEAMLRPTARMVERYLAALRQ